MKRLMSTIKKSDKSTKTPGAQNEARNSYIPPQGDSPEATVVREVMAFCESGAPDSQTAGEEYLHLPAIVESAESSPTAAAEAAATIRRYLSKENYQRGFAQYNSIMLMRILTDNPARPFTQNFDKQFVSTMKELLREGKDLSVQQILRETLDYFEAEKVKSNDTLTPLVEMWRKEKGKAARMYGNYANAPRGNSRYIQHQSNHQSRHRPQGLPAPDELAARIEEAKTTARLLLQTIQSTPSSEILTNDLVKEFADRAKSAHRSIQAYMSSENPHPDEDTMLTLIETNDQLNIAMSKHQRALLQARKALGLGTPSPQPQTQPSQGAFPPQPPQQQQPPPQNAYGQNATTQSVYTAAPASHPDSDFRAPPGPPPGARGAVRSQDYAYSPETTPRDQMTSPPSVQAAHYGVAENPFADDAAQAPPHQKHYGLFDKSSNNKSTPSPQFGYPQPSQNSSMYSDSQRPAGLWTGTQSYMHRQESATDQLTMHGASPPTQDRNKAPSTLDPSFNANASNDVNGAANQLRGLEI